MTDTADLPECVHANSMDQETSPRLPTELLWQIMSWSEAKDLWRYLFINRDFEAYIVAHRDYEFRCDFPLTRELLAEWEFDAKRSDLLKRIQTIAIQAKDLEVNSSLLPRFMPLLNHVKVTFPLQGFLLTLSRAHRQSRATFDASVTFDAHLSTPMVSAWFTDTVSDEALRESCEEAITIEHELFRIILGLIDRWRRITRTNPNVNYIRSLGIFDKLRIWGSSLTDLTALDINSFDLVSIDRGGYHQTGLVVWPEIKRLGLSISHRNDKYHNISPAGFLSSLQTIYPTLEELDLAPTPISWKIMTWPFRYDSWPILELGHLKVLKIAVDFAGIDDLANWTADSRLQPDVAQREGGGPKHLYIYIDFQRHAKIKDGVTQTPGCDPELVVRWIMQVVPRNSYVGVRDFDGPESKWLLQTREALYQSRRKR
ncbi:hypothetical protein FFLO_04723 [Filobasidium floriforme]|uniref:F-box domain-containing protein n=1 Tax=Filobasidium floriforme TaxID=5210 RepID=A0A8K0NS04_9TREE|nr:hypothetical protein FFLO_04723 [Filobasidium floriforme]